MSYRGTHRVQEREPTFSLLPSLLTGILVIGAHVTQTDRPAKPNFEPNMLKGGGFAAADCREGHNGWAVGIFRPDESRTTTLGIVGSYQTQIDEAGNKQQVPIFEDGVQVTVDHGVVSVVPLWNRSFIVSGISNEHPAIPNPLEGSHIVTVGPVELAGKLAIGVQLSCAPNPDHSIFTQNS